MCIHSFVQKDVGSVVEFFPELIRLLADPDISVAHSVNTFAIMPCNNFNIRQICECVPELINIVKLVQMLQVKVEYVHQNVLAPFVVLSIFALLQKIAPHNPDIGGELAALLAFYLQNCTTECVATAASLYEAVRACLALGLTSIPQMKRAISLFMLSSD
jgi:AP-4 complex subunit epsilon-1